MRRIVPIIVVCVVAVAAVVWLLDRGDTASIAALERPESPSAPASELSTLAREVDAPEPALREAAVAPVQAPSSMPRADTCVVIGRAVDENGRPLGAVDVRLSGYKIWANGVDVPRLPGRYDMRGYVTKTGDDGRFRFEVVLPTVEAAELKLEPEPFRDSARTWFGGKSPGSKPPLHAGENDAGTFQLVATGAIRGSVRDEAGAPIVEAQLTLGPQPSQTLGRDAWTDSAGRFVVGHSPPGSMGLGAKAEGFLSEFRKPIEVEIGRFTDHVDFVLRKAPTLKGVVVDDAGTPIEGVKLWGWPSSSGAGAGGKSAADGTFTVYFPQDEPYSLEATRDGFEPFGAGDRSTLYEPGRSDLRIVMKRVSSLTLVVVDAKTKEPIQRFGYRIIANQSRHTPHTMRTSSIPTRDEDRSGGRCEVFFRPGVDVIDVGSAGYEQEHVDLEPRDVIDGVIRVELARAAVVFGRVLVDGAPVTGVEVRLEGGSMREARQGAKTGKPRFQTNRDGTVSKSSAADGAFRFEGVGAGSYRLVARAGDGRAALVPVFTVGRGSSIDLSSLELTAGAEIRGVVLVPAGRRAGGLTVRLDDAYVGESTVTDSDGRFRFANVIAGAHQLFLPDVPGSFGLVAPLELELAAGEVREVEIDAREHGTCDVELVILIGDKPAVNATVSFYHGERRSSVQVGKTDSAGRVSASVPAVGPATLSLWTADRVTMEHPTARFDLVLDARILETVRFEVATLIIELPERVHVPKHFSASVQLDAPGAAPGRTQGRWIDVEDGATLDAGASVSKGGRQLRYDRLVAGDWELTFRIVDQDDPVETIQLSPTSTRTQPKVAYTATRAVTLRSGETATVDLR